MKAFKPTDMSAIPYADLTLPAPLTEAEAARVPGTLGRITAERVAAYRDAPLVDVSAAPSRPGFAAALRSSGLHIIAEVKRRSPSLGAIADLEPGAAARAYAAGGATCLSVLTEPNHFGGELSHLHAVAEAVSLPLLRKDFTVHPAQLLEAKAGGASAVLLIVAALQEHTASYLTLARELGLDALVEVHDERELELALTINADLIGVNNRDLKTLHIDLTTAPRLMKRARGTGFTGLLVAESGYSRADELQSVQRLADAVLIGGSVAGSGDLESAVQRFRTDLDALQAHA